MANSTCVARKKNVFKKQVIKWKENFSFVLRWKLFEHERNGMRNAPHTVIRNLTVKKSLFYNMKYECEQHLSCCNWCSFGEKWEEKKRRRCKFKDTTEKPQNWLATQPYQLVDIYSIVRWINCNIKTLIVWNVNTMNCLCMVFSQWLEKDIHMAHEFNHKFSRWKRWRHFNCRTNKRSSWHKYTKKHRKSSTWIWCSFFSVYSQLFSARSSAELSSFHFWTFFLRSRSLLNLCFF